LLLEPVHIKQTVQSKKLIREKKLWEKRLEKNATRARVLVRMMEVGWMIDRAGPGLFRGGRRKGGLRAEVEQR
jgi:hypothetical protein